jgi:hypothetical protein
MTMVEKRAKFTTAVLLVLLGAGLAVWVGRPMTGHLSSAIPYTFSAKPDETVAGLVPGDHLQYLYHLHLLRQAVDGSIPPFSNPFEFSGDYQRSTPYVYFPFSLVYVLFSYVTPAFGYNMLILLSFLATMIAGYGLARAWGANRGASVCAGIALTLFPYRLNALYGGHAAGSSFFLFPMAWWGLEKNWASGRKGWGLMAALSLMLMSVQDIHYLFFFCLLLPFWVLWKLLDASAIVLPDRTRTEVRRPASVVNGLGIAASVIFASASHFHQVRLRSASYVDPAFLGLLVFFLLVVIGMVWLIGVILQWLGVPEGRFRSRWLSWPWASSFLLGAYFAADRVNRPGFGSKLAFASLGLFVLLHLGFLMRAIQKKRLAPGTIRLPWKRFVAMWPSVVGLLIALIYPLYLKFMVFAKSGVAGGRTLFEVSLFSIPCHELFVRSPQGGAYVGWSLIGIPLVGLLSLLSARRGYRPVPEERRRFRISLVLTWLGMILACGVLLERIFPLYNVLYRLIPFLSYIRSTGKYLILTATGGAVALALILTFLRGGPTRFQSPWLALAVGLLLILDFGPISAVGVSVLPKRTPLYEKVRSSAKGGRLLELPIWPGDSAFSSAYQYGTILTGIPTINGYSPTVPTGYKENIADPLYSLNFGIFGQDEFDLLKSQNVSFITFHSNLFPRQVSSLPPTHSLKRLLLNPNLNLLVEEQGSYLFQITSPELQPVAGMEASSVLHYVPCDALQHQVGEPSDDPGAVEEKAWSSDGREGFLFYGPFLMLPPGEYVAVFRVMVGGRQDLPEIGYLDVFTGDGNELSTRHALKPSDWPETYGYRFVEIPFQVSRPHPVQTRGFFNGNEEAALSLDFVMIKRQGQGENISLEAEDFFSTGGRVSVDKEATEGISLEIVKPVARGKPILEETFVFLPAGRFEVSCSARGSRNLLATLRIRRSGASTASRTLDVRGGDGENLVVSQASLNLATGGVYGVSLWPAGKGLEAVDCISFTWVSPI